MDLDPFSRAVERFASAPLLEHAGLFKELSDEIDIGAIVANEMARWISEPRRPPPIVSEHTIRLRRFGPFVLDVTVLRSTGIPRVITSHPDILQRFCETSHYDLFDIVAQDGVPAALVRGPGGVVSPDEVLAMDGSRQVFVPHSPQPIRFISLSGFESRGVRYKFDSVSLERIGTFAASPASTTLQLAARFLGYYGDERCAPALRHLLGDPIAAISWEAACALARVSPDDGLAAMKRLASSADPDLAHAAGEAVAQLSG